MAPRLMPRAGGADQAAPDTADQNGEKGTDGGPFSETAVDLYRRGMTPLPCPGDGGKSVEGAVKGHGKWRKRPPLAWIEKMVKLWPAENVGILTRLSGVTVVDVDDPALVDAMVARFGKTPLKTRTPSGGVHLWYRGSGGADHNLRASEGLAVDLRSNGIVIVPPSRRPSGEFAGCRYEFFEGSWDDLARLPKVRPASLPIIPQSINRPSNLRAVKEGRRNDTLFRQLLRHARHCDDKHALQDVANTINEDFDPPLPPAEVIKIGESAWKYQLTGRNWVGTEAKVLLNASEIGRLIAHRNGSDASLLYLKVRLANCARPVFAVSPKAMARDRVISGWAHGRYRNALHALTEIGLLKIVHRGGQGAGDPRLFAFMRPAMSDDPE